jgi:hypothetical protein
VTFRFKKEFLAQALSIVAECGVHGMKYNYPVETLVDTSVARRSKRFRVSLVSAHVFSKREFEDYLILAWRFGLVDRSRYSEYDIHGDLNKSSYEIEDETLQLTQKGWEFVEAHDQPLMHRWARNIVENAPTVVVSVAAALLSGWAIYLFGAPN